MEYFIQCTLYGVLYMEYFIRCMSYGVLYKVYVIWSTLYGILYVVYFVQLLQHMIMPQRSFDPFTPSYIQRYHCLSRSVILFTWTTPQQEVYVCEVSSALAWSVLGQVQ